MTEQAALFDPAGRPTLEAARAARDAGMQQAMDHAESDTPGWSVAAYQFLREYATANERFMGWMVTQSAELSKRVPAPKTKKSWGSQFTKAQREKLIVIDDYKPDVNRHCNPAPVYRSLIYQGETTNVG